MKKLIPASWKHFIKKYAWRQVYANAIGPKGAAANRLFLHQKVDLRQQPLNLFTRHNEDGILLWLLSHTGHGSRVFVDIGSNDCINSNCANLAFHHQWSGLFIDGNEMLLNRGRYIYQAHFGREAAGRFVFLQAMVTPQTINPLLEAQNLPQVQLLSIDLDGNDYHIWNAISVIQPVIVVVEVQVEKGLENFVPPYDHVFEPYESDIPKGASPKSMAGLASQKGYALVAANTGGFNLFFVRNDCMNGLQPLAPEDLFH